MRFVILASILAVTLSLTSLFSSWYNRPADTVYPLVHNYPPDFYSNLSWMQFGAEGKLSVTSRYTPERFKPQIVSVLPVLGWIANSLRLPLPLAYTIYRVLFGFGLLIASYFLASRLLGKNRLIAFLLILFGSPLWRLENGSIVLPGKFWTGFDPLTRVTFLPHHLLANIFFILSIIALARAIETNDYRKSAAAGLLAFAGGWTNPATIYTLGVAVAAAIFSRRALHVIIFFAPLVLLYVYLNNLQFSSFPFTTYKDVERFWFYPANNGEMLWILGISAPLAILACFFAIKTKKILWLFVVGWFAAPFIGVEILHRFVPVTNARYFQTAPYISTAILATLAITKIGSLLPKSHLKAIFVGVTIGLLVLGNIPSFISSFLYMTKPQPFTLLTYIPRSMYGAIQWLGGSGQSDEVVLANSWASAVIPGLTNKRVFLGHAVNTLNLQEKFNDLSRFYWGNDPDFAATLIDRYDISYVVFEKPEAPNFPFLVPVYENKGVVIFATQRCQQCGQR